MAHYSSSKQSLFKCPWTASSAMFIKKFSPALRVHFVAQIDVRWNRSTCRHYFQYPNHAKCQLQDHAQALGSSASWLNYQKVNVLIKLQSRKFQAEFAVAYSNHSRLCSVGVFALYVQCSSWGFSTIQPSKRGDVPKVCMTLMSHHTAEQYGICT